MRAQRGWIAPRDERDGVRGRRARSLGGSSWGVSGGVTFSRLEGGRGQAGRPFPRAPLMRHWGSAATAPEGRPSADLPLCVLSNPAPCPSEAGSAPSSDSPQPPLGKESPFINLSWTVSGRALTPSWLLSLGCNPSPSPRLGAALKDQPSAELPCGWLGPLLGLCHSSVLLCPALLSLAHS